MGRLADMQMELASSVHMEVMGDTVTRTPKTGPAVPGITAIWNETHIDRDIELGERGIRTGILQVLSTQIVARGDVWTIDGEQWVLAPHEWLGATNGAFRAMHLQRNEKVTTREPSTRLV